MAPPLQVVQLPPTNALCGRCISGQCYSCLVSSETHQPELSNPRKLYVRWNTCACTCNAPDSDHPKHLPRRWP